MPLFQSITSFFNPQHASSSSSSSSSRHASRRSVMNSTFDAFSLPTTNNILVGLSDPRREVPSAMDSVSSPGPSRRGSYSYPVQTDQSNRPALAYFPPLSNTFHRLRNALSDTFPEIIETLNPPVNPILLSSFEAELGCPLPPPVRDTFLIADGQDIDSPNSGLFFGLHLLPLEEVIREWTFWRQAEHDPNAGKNAAVLATMASIPPKWIKPLYACRGWLPLITDHSGNYIGVDLDPGPGGAWGQVIVFGRDFDRKCVLWRGESEGGWGKWFASFVDDLESGEGWEADKSNSSDDEEEIGYESYNGGARYGEIGRGLRLAGAYKGWNVMEAWWDKSVRKWEGLGLGMDVDEIEKGLEEARRLAGLAEIEDGEEEQLVKGKGKQKAGTGLGIKTPNGIAGDNPIATSPIVPQPPGTPVPRDSDSLLPPSSPEAVLSAPIPRIQPPSPVQSPIRVITPVLTTTDHPLKIDTNAPGGDGFLSPPTDAPPRLGKRVHKPAPTPTPLDLPTRADVQAMSAIAQAESSGLRGGWIMHLDTSASSAQRRAQAATTQLASPTPPFSQPSSRSGSPRLSALSPNPYRHSLDAEMVDIDLESGEAKPFGSPHMSEAELQKQLDEEKLAMAGLEHRRSPLTSPQLSSSSNFSRPVSPSPLSMEPITISNPYDEPTPRAPSREDPSYNVPPSVVAATNALRRPPPIAMSSEGLNVNGSMRSITPDGGEREQEVIRGFRRVSAPRDRAQRESSVVSEHSDDGLLDRESERERWRMSHLSTDTGNGSESEHNSPRPSSAFTPISISDQPYTNTPILLERQSSDLEPKPKSKSSGLISPITSAPNSATTPTQSTFPPLASPLLGSDESTKTPSTTTTKHTRSAGSIVAARKKALEDAMQEVQLESGKRGSKVVIGKR